MKQFQLKYLKDLRNEDTKNILFELVTTQSDATKFIGSFLGAFAIFGAKIELYLKKLTTYGRVDINIPFIQKSIRVSLIDKEGIDSITEFGEYEEVIE